MIGFTYQLYALGGAVTALAAAAALAACGTPSGSGGGSPSSGSGSSAGETSGADSGPGSSGAGIDEDGAPAPGDSGAAGAAHDGGSTSPGSPLDGGAPGASASPRPSPGCADGGGATSETVSITAGGTLRSYDLHVPSGGPAGPRPLVVNLHGYTGSPAQQEGLTAMNSLADAEGFLVAYPAGVGSPTDWNAGACCSAASEGDRDDIGFLDAVIDRIAASTCVDLARVYSMGFSNGGMMTYRLACQDSQRFAAAASVSGSAVIPLDTCSPAHPVPLMHVHGNADPLVPFDGGPGALPLAGRPTPVFPAAADEVAAFRSKDGCPPTSTVSFDQGNARCERWGPCAGGSEVVFCTIDQGGHAWPGGTGVFSEASPLDATRQIWSFFKGHALP